MPTEVLSYLADNIIYVAGVVGALVTLTAVGPKFFHWYVDKFKRQNRDWQEFLIKGLYDKSFDPYLIIESRSLDCTYTNVAMRRLFSAGDQDFKGKAWFRLIEPLELADVLKSWRDAFDNKSDYMRTVNVVLPDNTRLKMQFTGEAFIYLNRTRAFLVSAKAVLK